MMDDMREAVPQSCKPCRLRKAKCDRGQPCHNCTKANSACIYEKIFRSPLTRKHLTDVENELARTKALLEHYGLEQESSVSRVGERANRRKRRAQDRPPHNEQVSVVETSTENVPTTALGSDQVGQHSSHMVLSPSPVGMNITGFRSPGIQRTGQQVERSSIIRWDNNEASHTSSAFSMETPPKGDFDWDERLRSKNQFADGMAALTESSSRGYMGVASGAALLRLADNNENASAVETGTLRDETAHNTPPLPALFSLSQLEHFVDAYFSTYHISYPIVHEASFRAQFMELIPRPGGNAWQVLLHIIATIGAFAAADFAPESDLALFEAAKARMSIDMLETGNITLVQALALLSNYVQKRNKPNSGYNYLGLAKRVALGIGLHKEFPSWQSRPLMLEIRRRVWYCLYIFDFGAIITFSRPLDLPRGGIEVQLPLNISDGDITASTKTWPGETQGTTLYTHLRCQAQFHLATSKIYEHLIASYPPVEEMLELDRNHLEVWLHNLPPYFVQEAHQNAKYRLSHSVLQWRWRNLRILMYRPYLIRHFINRSQRPHQPIAQLEELAIHKCLDSVAETIHLITAYWQREKQDVLTCWYALYFLFQALLIPVICLRNDPISETTSTCRQQIIDALKTISSMARLNSAADRCYSTIMNLCAGFLGTDTPPTLDESPQTQLNALQSFMWPIVDPELCGGYESLQESAAYDFMANFGPFGD